MDTATTSVSPATTSDLDTIASTVASNAIEIVLTRGRLLAAVKSTLRFVCQDQTRFHLNSIAIEAIDSHLRCVATDGHTLARADVPFDTGTSKRAGDLDTVLLRYEDAKALVQALKHTKKTADHPVSISFSGPKHRCVITVRIDSTVLTYTALDAPFPPYEQVIPARASKGSCAVVGFNPHYIARVCDAISDFGRDVASSRGARFQFGRELDPARVDFDAPDLGDFLAVIMPMRM